VKAVKMDSADKEVRIVQIMKRSEREREDLMGLGIALESKQQELELVSFHFFSENVPNSDILCCRSRES